MEDFFPGIQVKTKKEGLHQNWKIFSPKSSEDQRSDADQSQIIRGDADVDHTQIIGEIYPPSPRVSAPLRAWPQNLQSLQ